MANKKVFNPLVVGNFDTVRDDVADLTTRPYSSLTGYGTGVSTALGIAVGSAGAPVLFNGALGTPSSGTLTNATGLPISTGVSGLGSGVATFLATPSSANLASALTDKTGTGVNVFGTSPTFTTQITTPLIYGGNSGTSGITIAGDDGTPFTGNTSAGGRVTIDDPITLLSTDRTFTSSVENFISLDGTYTLDFASATVSRGFSFSPILIFNQAPGAATGTVFVQEADVRNVSGTGMTLRKVFGFAHQALHTAVAATANVTDQWDYTARHGFRLSGGGAAMTVTDYIKYYSTVSAFGGLGTIASGITVTNLKAFYHEETTGAGTLVNQIGLDIAGLTKGTTMNLGIRNAAGTAYTPKVKTITAAGNSISVAATDTSTAIRLDNTSGGSITLTSTPTITSGQDGQILYIYNSSSQNVVFQRDGALAGSNLRLGAATRTLGQYDTLTLLYDATNAEWMEINFTDNT